MGRGCSIPLGDLVLAGMGSCHAGGRGQTPGFRSVLPPRGETPWRVCSESS